MTNMQLSACEKEELERAIRRATEFEQGEEMELMRQPLQGQLLKPRWFVLDPKAGELKYYLKEEHKKHPDSKPRGFIVLAGSMIAPSEEDSNAFSVTPVAGEPFKLKASDTRQRSEWINRLRVVSEDHGERKYRKAMAATGKTPAVTEAPVFAEPLRRGTAQEAAILHQLHRVTTVAAEQQEAMCRAAEGLGDHFNDEDILLLKATSLGLMASLQKCQGMLDSMANVKISSTPSSSTNSPQMSKKSRRRKPESRKASFAQTVAAITEESSIFYLEESSFIQGLIADLDKPLEPMKPNEEVPEETVWVEEELGSVEEWKGEILGQLSRLKLGTDLTRVPFPLFAARSHSFLQLLSDFFAHSQLLLAAPEKPTPEQRLVQVVKWYLSSFYFGLQNGLPRKAYNPLEDEVFRCSWAVGMEGSAERRLEFYAEQVSHEPGVSAFRAAGERVLLSGFVSPRAKFMGISFTASLHGHTRLLLSPVASPKPEEYTISYPVAHGRSIFTTPWLELAGKGGDWSRPEEYTISYPVAHGRSIFTTPWLELAGKVWSRPEEYTISYPVAHGRSIFTTPWLELAGKGGDWSRPEEYTISYPVAHGRSIFTTPWLELAGKGGDWSRPEEYTISYPVAHGRSIFTTPWLELAGKVSISCRQSGTSATLTFHTKPFYGGKLHRVTAEMRNYAGAIYCKAQGEWNSQIEFNYTNGDGASATGRRRYLGGHDSSSHLHPSLRASLRSSGQRGGAAMGNRLGLLSTPVAEKEVESVAVAAPSVQRSSSDLTSSFLETIRQLREKKRRPAPEAREGVERSPSTEGEGEGGWPAASSSAKLHGNLDPLQDNEAVGSEEESDESLDLDSDATGHQVHTEIFYESIVDGPVPSLALISYPELAKQSSHTHLSKSSSRSKSGSSTHSGSTAGKLGKQRLPKDEATQKDDVARTVSHESEIGGLTPKAMMERREKSRKKRRHNPA